MSGALLQQQVMALLRAKFTTQEVVSVSPYGGEFTPEESSKVSYDCPGIFVTVLGSQPIKQASRTTGRYMRNVALGAFVVTKHARREVRMAMAMTLAERAALLIEDWSPTSTEQVSVFKAEDGCRIENLYSRSVDAKGQALWLVTWSQVAQARVPPTELFDLLAIDIVDHTLRGEVPEPPAPPPATPLIVTEDVQFVQDPPPPEGA